MSCKKIAVTAMAINTPLGDSVESVGQNLLQGKSAISRWQGICTDEIYSKIGGDLSFYDAKQALAKYENGVPSEMFNRAQRVFKQVPRETQLSILMAMDAYVSSGIISADLNAYDVGVVCGGHNLMDSYLLKQYDIFKDEPEFIAGLTGLNILDTDHSSSVAEVLDLKSCAFTVGGTCATGNLAIQNAIDLISNGSAKVVFVVCPVASFSPLMLQALTILDAISYENFNENPEKASRPYDSSREGFVPCEGGAVLVLESLEHAENRNAEIHAEVLGTAFNSDANHLGNPSQEGQVHVMKTLLDKTGIAPEEVDFVSAHATSTRLGDVVEINSIKEVFGEHAYELFVNAPKSLLGHTMWAAGAVETAMAIWQMNKGIFHQSHNIDSLDLEVDLNVCAQGNIERKVNVLMNNSFGMGGINSASLFKRYVV